MSIFTRKRAKATGSRKNTVKGTTRSSKPKSKSIGSKGGPAKRSTKKKPPARVEKLLKSSRSWKWRLVKWVCVITLIVGLIPVTLAIVYKLPFVHPVSTLMLSERLKGNPVTRTWVDFEEISPVLVHSVMISEDGQFCAHDGVDWGAVELVIDQAFDGETPRGASTIPMQSAKNLFLWSSRSYVRKVLEVPVALMADFVLGKKRLMEIYLNVAEWGPGIYGIEAASQHHFKRSAKNLTRRQAALLAVALPNPVLRKPSKPPRGLTRLARLIERRAKQSGAYVKCLY